MSAINRPLNRSAQHTEGSGDRRASMTPWVVAIGMVLLALISASCVETNSRDQSTTKDNTSQDYQAPNTDWNPRASAGSEWTIDDVESTCRGSVMGVSPALAVVGQTIVDFFAVARYDVPDTIRSGNNSPLELTQTTTVVAAQSQADSAVAAMTAPMVASVSVVSVNEATAPSRLGAVVKSNKPVAASKMSASEVDTYLASLKVCQPPFPARAVASTATSPRFQTSWCRGGPRPIGAGDDTPEVLSRPETETTASAATPVEPSPSSSSKPAVAVAMTPVHIPAMRPVWAGLLGIALGLAALGAALLTIGLAFAHARTTDRGGNAHRSLTLRARLTLAFGAMATLGLTACALAAGLMVVSVPGAVQIIACAVICIAAPIGLWMWLQTAIIEPIARASEAVCAIASGDLLRSPLNSISRDECGELCRGIDRLAATMRDAFTEVAISTTAVSGAAGQIASGTQQMSDAVGSVVRKCSDAAASAAEASRVVGEGRGAIRKSAEDIRRVDADACLQSESAHAIQARAERVGKLVELIEDLADRSHLVALNASVEASRAGAASGPFGQLAEEARRISERAQNAVAEASRTVESLDADAQSIGQRADQSALHARNGAAVAATANEDLERIALRTSDVAGVTRSAATAAEEAGADAAQSAAIAAQLSTRTSDIMAVVGRFKLGTERLIRQGPTGTVAVPTNRP